MATYYADKANEIQENGGNVEPWDTAGRVRVAYDQFTVGSENVPDESEANATVIFCGAGIPPHSRILGGHLQWTDIRSGLSLSASINIGATTSTPEVGMAEGFGRGATWVMNNPGGHPLVPYGLASPFGYAPRIGDLYVFPSIAFNDRILNEPGDCSIRVFYVLD